MEECSFLKSCRLNTQAKGSFKGVFNFFKIVQIDKWHKCLNVTKSHKISQISYTTNTYRFHKYYMHSEPHKQKQFTRVLEIMQQNF